MLVQVCGLPGAGKSTLSAAIAERLPAVVLRVDAIEAAMWKYAISPEQSGIAAYSVMHAIAIPNLRRGQLVIADAVSSVEPARAGWVATAQEAGVPLRVIEVVCPDSNEHRRRVEQRPNDLPGFTLPTWKQVQRTADEYEPRTDERLIIDSTRPLDETVRDALRFIDGADQ
ncbi:AAA family ATPase [Curtobacterium sp. RRHDQ10]|uniref:AAA family ATPase n=1 Tax=Curtobacterium phyllosphaerae TaxID=3413379 RepID=UPI003BF07635